MGRKSTTPALLLSPKKKGSKKRVATSDIEEDDDDIWAEEKHGKKDEVTEQSDAEATPVSYIIKMNQFILILCVWFRK